MEENIERLIRLEEKLTTIDDRLDQQNVYVLRLGERFDTLADHKVRLDHLELSMKDLVDWRSNLWKTVLVASASGAIVVGTIIGGMIWIAKIM